MAHALGKTVDELEGMPVSEMHYHVAFLRMSGKWPDMEALRKAYGDQSKG